MGTLEPDDITQIVANVVTSVHDSLPVVLPPLLDEYLRRALPGIVRDIAEGVAYDAIREALQREMNTFTITVTAKKR